jgi:hypothetical protein
MVVFGAEVVVDGHALGGACGSVVESVVLFLPVGGCGALIPDGVGDPQGAYPSPCSGCIAPNEKEPAIVDVAEVDLVLAGEEELMWRGKNGKGTFAGVKDFEAISCA